MEQQTLDSILQVAPWAVGPGGVAYALRSFLPGIGAFVKERLALRDKREADARAFVEKLVSDSQAANQRIIDAFRADLEARDVRFTEALKRHDESIDRLTEAVRDLKKGDAHAAA